MLLDVVSIVFTNRPVWSYRVMMAGVALKSMGDWIVRKSDAGFGNSVTLELLADSCVMDVVHGKLRVQVSLSNTKTAE